MISHLAKKKKNRLNLHLISLETGQVSIVWGRLDDMCHIIITGCELACKKVAMVVEKKPITAGGCTTVEIYCVQTCQLFLSGVRRNAF